MKPTLFVLAAGMGSRYGGLKQLDGLGPNGETIMDYSIFDAIRKPYSGRIGIPIYRRSACGIYLSGRKNETLGNESRCING